MTVAFGDGGVRCRDTTLRDARVSGTRAPVDATLRSRPETFSFRSVFAAAAERFARPNVIGFSTVPGGRCETNYRCSPGSRARSGGNPRSWSGRNEVKKRNANVFPSVFRSVRSFVTVFPSPFAENDFDDFAKRIVCDGWRLSALFNRDNIIIY